VTEFLFELDAIQTHYENNKNEGPKLWKARQTCGVTQTPMSFTFSFVIYCCYVCYDCYSYVLSYGVTHLSMMYNRQSIIGYALFNKYRCRIVYLAMKKKLIARCIDLRLYI